MLRQAERRTRTRGDPDRAAQTRVCPLPQSLPVLTTVVDGVLLPKMPEEMLAQKLFNPVPFIVGFNKQEFGWLLPMVSSRRPPPLPSAHHDLGAPDCLLLQTPPGSQAAAPFPWVDVSMETSGMAQLTPGW